MTAWPASHQGDEQARYALAVSEASRVHTTRCRGDPAQGSRAGQRVLRGTLPHCPARRRAYRACCFAVLHHHGVVETCSTLNQAGNAGAAAAGCVKKDVPSARSVSGQTLTRLLPWTKYVSELPRDGRLHQRLHLSPGGVHPADQAVVPVRRNTERAGPGLRSRVSYPRFQAT